jgi:hypothetical protein
MRNSAIVYDNEDVMMLAAEGRMPARLRKSTNAIGVIQALDAKWDLRCRYRKYGTIGVLAVYSNSVPAVAYSVTAKKRDIATLLCIGAPRSEAFVADFAHCLQLDDLSHADIIFDYECIRRELETVKRKAREEPGNSRENIRNYLKQLFTRKLHIEI